MFPAWMASWSPLLSFLIVQSHLVPSFRAYTFRSSLQLHSWGACTGSRQVFIGISGLIGAGKSTLAKSLAERLDLPVHYEPVADNEYLEDFYGDIKKYSFPMQVYLLNRRFQQQQQIVWQGHGGVQDRTIYEDSVFARMLRNSGLMDERDYQTYCR